MKAKEIESEVITSQINKKEKGEPGKRRETGSLKDDKIRRKNKKQSGNITGRRKILEREKTTSAGKNEGRIQIDRPTDRQTDRQTLEEEIREAGREGE